MTGQLKSAVHGQTLVLTLSNPTLRNALGPEMYTAGIEALNAAESNSEIRSVIITGEGAHFCAGGNLQRLLANREQAKEVQAQSIDGLHTWMEAIHTFPKPVIAAVEGAAAGAGFSLVLMCDLVVAARDSIFVMAYSSIALSPDGGGSWNLSQALPRQIAAELMLLGERITAYRLHALGSINRLVESGTALTQALDLAERINARAPNAMQSIKELINDAANQSLHMHLAQERDHFVNNLHHANSGIGISAFLNKEKPIYK
jgi:enoyl-CoA hydratase/carnithine racemase